MSDYAGDCVWQTTHTGGHCFAATLICLPHGVFYGQVAEEEVSHLVDDHRAGRIYHLDRYRGRSSYPCIVQAADTFLRGETGDLDLSSFSLASVEPMAEDAWAVVFATRTGNELHRLQVTKKMTPLQYRLSCGKDGGECLPEYHLDSYVVFTR
jgi:hypothetical protein